MPVENASRIDQLDPAMPPADDQIAEGQAHIRLIKAALKNSFPNLAGPVTATHTQLSAAGNLATRVSDLEGNRARTDVDTAFAGLVDVAGSVNGRGGIFENTKRLVPRGIIAWWYGAPEQCPAGWQLCDGSNGAPDLRGLYLFGAGNGLSPYARVGENNVSVSTSASGSHGHTTDTQGRHAHSAQTDIQGIHHHGGSTQGHALTDDQMPPHTHQVGTEGGNGNDPDGVPDSDRVQNFGAGNGPNRETSAAGSGNPHAHGIALDGGHQHGVAVEPTGEHAHNTSVAPNHAHTVSFDNRPLSIALWPIMKS